MSINITDGFNINYAAPVDYRIVSGNTASRLAIAYKYDGLRVFQLDNRIGYIWNATTVTWDTENSNGISGVGTTNYIPKFISSSQLGTSSIYVNGNKVGINTSNPIGSNTYLQIGSYPVSYVGESLPLVFHKGSTTVIGYNWYDNASTDAYFRFNVGSSKIIFSGGDITFATRPGSGSFKNSMVIGPGLVTFSDGPLTGSSKSAGIRSQGSSLFSTQTTPDFTWYNNDQTGIFRPASDTIAFTNGGVESVRINSSGVSTFYNNVGIGNSNPTYKLTVNGLVQGASVLSKTVGGQVLRIGSSIWNGDVHLLTGQVDVSNNGYIQVTLGDSSYNGSNIGLTPYNLQIQPGGGNTYIGLGSLVSITPTLSDLLTVTGTASITKVKLSDGTDVSPSLTFALASNTGIYRQPYVACPDPNTQILLSNNISVRAGDLKVGDFVYSIHENTGIWDNYKVLFVEIVGNQDKLLINFSDGTDISVSKSHKFLMTDDKWKLSSDLLIGDSIKGIELNKKITLITSIGFGDVVKIEIEHAHTYVSNGVISHNKIIASTPESMGFSIASARVMKISAGNVFLNGVVQSYTGGYPVTVGNRNLRIGASINAGAGLDVAVNIGTVNDYTNRGVIQVLNNANVDPFIGNTPYTLALQPSGGDVIIGTTNSVCNFTIIATASIFGNVQMLNTGNVYPRPTCSNSNIYSVYGPGPSYSLSPGTYRSMTNSSTYTNQITATPYDRYISVLAQMHLIKKPSPSPAVLIGSAVSSWGSSNINFSISGVNVCALRSSIWYYSGTVGTTTVYDDGPSQRGGFFVPAGVTVDISMSVGLQNSLSNAILLIDDMREFKLGR